MIQNISNVAGFLPAGLPTSCLTMAPRFDTLKPVDVSRKPLTEVNGVFCLRCVCMVKQTCSCTCTHIVTCICTYHPSMLCHC